MPKKSKHARNFTDRSCQTVKAGEKRIDYRDDNNGSWNLMFRVEPWGSKSWAVRYRVGSERKLLTLGAYPGVTLSKARSRSLEIAALVSEGINPEDAEKEARGKSMTFGDLASEYIQLYCKDNQKSWDQTERIFNNHILPTLGRVTLLELDRGKVIELLDKLEEKGLTAQVNRVLSQIKAAFSWAVESRDYLTVNPIATLHAKKRRVPEKSRQRVLSGDEVKALWNVADTLTPPSNQLVKVLILTGQRRDEVRCMRWEELDLKKKQWLIPGSRNKAKRNHLVPLGPEVVKLIKEVPRIKKSEWVFSVSGDKPYAGMKRLKEILDRDSGLKSWTIHDLRRTFRTGLSALAVPPEIRTRCMNHATGSKLDGVYDMYEFVEEKRAAMTAWAKYVERVVAGGDNVIELTDRTAS